MPYWEIHLFHSSIHSPWTQKKRHYFLIYSLCLQWRPFQKFSEKFYKFKFLTVMGICYRVPTDKYCSITLSLVGTKQITNIQISTNHKAEPITWRNASETTLDSMWYSCHTICNKDVAFIAVCHGPALLSTGGYERMTVYRRWIKNSPQPAREACSC